MNSRSILQCGICLIVIRIDVNRVLVKASWRGTAQILGLNTR